MPLILSEARIPNHSFGLFDRFSNAVKRAFETYVRKRSRIDLIEALEAKSDDELARLGIRRDQIVAYAFRDLMHH